MGQYVSGYYDTNYDCGMSLYHRQHINYQKSDCHVISICNLIPYNKYIHNLDVTPIATTYGYKIINSYRTKTPTKMNSFVDTNYVFKQHLHNPNLQKFCKIVISGDDYKKIFNTLKNVKGLDEDDIYNIIDEKTYAT